MVNIIKYLIILIFILIISLYYTFKPNLYGIIQHQKSNYGTVTIYRDDYGIPHVQGESINSVCYGQGFSQGQDRLFQIHLKKLFAQGRISEFAGKSTLGIDMYMRELGLSRQAKIMADNIKPDLLQCMQAFSEGINDYVSNLNLLPIEFYLSGCKWEKWTVSDTQLMFSLLSFQLVQDHIWEMFHSEVRQIYGEEITREILGHNEDQQFTNDTIFTDDELKDIGIFQLKEEHHYSKDIKNKSNINKDYKIYKTQYSKVEEDQIYSENILEFLYSMFAHPAGSNSWVLGGNHTATGKPILCNDPHIPSVIPGNLHQTELLFNYKGKKKHAIGFTTSGIPFVVFGKTDYVSYGVTVSFIDTSDLYLETFDDQNLHYAVDGKLRKLKVFKEEIYIKGVDKPVLHEVYETHRGPVIKHLFNIFNKNPLEQLPQPCSLSWIGHIQKDQSLQAIYQITLAQNIQELDNVIQIFTAPGLMFNYATVDGDYGMSFLGNIPIRKNQQNGIFLKNGITSEDDWIGFYKGNEQPNHRNSKKGYYVSANNRLASDNIKHVITLNQFTTPRASRITEVFNNKISKNYKFNTFDMMKLQSDVLDIYPRQVLKGLIGLFQTHSHTFLTKKEHEICQNLIDQIKDWDYNFYKHSTQATIYIVWEYLFMNTLYNDIALERSRTYVIGSFFSETYVYRRLNHWIQLNQSYVEEFWCRNSQYNNEDNNSNELKNQSNNCLRTLFKALSNAKQFLINQYQSENNQDWIYGKLQLHKFSHSIFGTTVLKNLYDRQFQGSGHRRTVAVTMQEWYKQTFGSKYSAAMRMIVSMDENDKSYWIIDTGANENIYSQHYDDQLNIFKNFEYIEMKYGEKHLSSYKNKMVLQYNNNNTIN